MDLGSQLATRAPRLTAGRGRPAGKVAIAFHAASASGTSLPSAKNVALVVTTTIVHSTTWRNRLGGGSVDYPFRIESAATSQARTNILIAHGAGPAPPQAGADPLQQYLGRVLRLIPTEVVSLYQGIYVVVKTAAATDTGARSSIVWLPWLGASLVVFVRSWGTRDGTGSWRSVQ